MGPIVVLFLLVAGHNLIFRQLGPRLALRRTEVLLIYIMLLSTAAMATTGFAAWLSSIITAPFYYADPGNRWEELFFKHIRWWLHPPADAAIIRPYYERLPHGAKIPWHAWKVPLLAWGIFTTFFYGMFVCWCSLLRRRWIESEKLTFPLVQVPLALAGTKAIPPGRESILFNRLMWMGVAVPAVIHSFNSLHIYVQGFPQMKLTDIDIGEPFQMEPWTELKSLRVFVLFSVIPIT